MSPIYTDTDTNIKSYQTPARIFKALDDKFRLKQHKAILSLQHCKLSRYSNQTVKELTGRLRMKAAECKYKENGKQMEKQLINGIDDHCMTSEIIRDSTSM